MIALKNLLAGNYTAYQYFYVRVPDPQETESLYCKPGGTYLRGFCKGKRSELPAAYARMAEFAEKCRLRLCGYSFEEIISEPALSSCSDAEKCVTQITIPCCSEHAG